MVRCAHDGVACSLKVGGLAAGERAALHQVLQHDKDITGIEVISNVGIEGKGIGRDLVANRVVNAARDVEKVLGGVGPAALRFDMERLDVIAHALLGHREGGERDGQRKR